MASPPTAPNLLAQGPGEKVPQDSYTAWMSRTKGSTHLLNPEHHHVSELNEESSCTPNLKPDTFLDDR